MHSMLVCIDEESAQVFAGKRVIVRADFNVPIENGEVTDTFRLEQGWKTVQYLVDIGAKVIILTHIGRDPEESSEPVAHALKQFGNVHFVPDITGDMARTATAAMQGGEVVLLENIRRDPRETENDAAFAAELAALGDVYVGDAFAASHRAHASIVGVPKILPAYAGFLVRDEVREIDAARTPLAPSLAILGGAKFETKAPLVQLLLEKYDNVFLTGALANDVFRAKGYTTGRSLTSKELPDQSILTNPRFLAPVDVTAEDATGHAAVKKPDVVTADDKIVDIGPDSVALLAPYITKAKFILWNGPTGLYESGYTHYVRQISELVEKAVDGGAKVVIGGGDTIAAIEASGAKKQNLGFLSTGGGAMLEYLLKGTLPGIEVLNR